MFHVRHGWIKAPQWSSFFTDMFHSSSGQVQEYIAQCRFRNTQLRIGFSIYIYSSSGLVYTPPHGRFILQLRVGLGIYFSSWVGLGIYTLQLRVGLGIYTLQHRVRFGIYTLQLSVGLGIYTLQHRVRFGIYILQLRIGLGIYTLQLSRVGFRNI